MPLEHIAPYSFTVATVFNPLKRVREGDFAGGGSGDSVTNRMAVEAIRSMDGTQDDARRVLAANPAVIALLDSDDVTADRKADLFLRLMDYAPDDDARRVLAANPAVVALLDTDDITPDNKAVLASWVIQFSPNDDVAEGIASKTHVIDLLDNLDVLSKDRALLAQWLNTFFHR